MLQYMCFTSEHGQPAVIQLDTILVTSSHARAHHWSHVDVCTTLITWWPYILAVNGVAVRPPGRASAKSHWTCNTGISARNPRSDVPNNHYASTSLFLYVYHCCIRIVLPFVFAWAIPVNIMDNQLTCSHDCQGLMYAHAVTSQSNRWSCCCSQPWALAVQVLACTLKLISW